jgi:Recombination endonuclease VII
VKRCTHCGELQPETEFYAERTGKGGLRADCKACFAVRRKRWYTKNKLKVIANVQQWRRDNPVAYREYQRRYRQEHAGQAREWHLRRTFGMSLGDYAAILAAQEGGCAICGDAAPDGLSLHVDHCDSGVRGILCVRCNNGLGQFKDDPDLLLRAAEYALVGGFSPLWLVRQEADGSEN